MSSGTTLVHGMLNLTRGLGFSQDQADFPPNPRIGTMILRGQALYAYLTIGGLRTWYPLVRNNETTSIYTQAVPSLNWLVLHNLNTENIWYQVQDPNGNIISQASTIIVDNNTLSIHFTEPVIGSVIVVGTTNLGVTEINTNLINVGDDVVIDTAGVTVFGERLVSKVNIEIADVTGNTALSFTNEEKLQLLAGPGIEIFFDEAGNSIQINATGNAGPSDGGSVLLEQARAEAAESYLQDQVNTKANISGDGKQAFATANLDVVGALNVLGTTTISGDLIIQGTQTTVHSNDTSVSDNIIVLNDGEAGGAVTAGTAGLSIDRGSSPNFNILFDEASQGLKVGFGTQLKTVPTKDQLYTRAEVDALVASAVALAIAELQRNAYSYG